MSTTSPTPVIEGEAGNGNGNGHGTSPLPAHMAFTTTDMQCAAYLISHGCQLVGMRTDDLESRNGMRLNGGGTKRFFFEGVRPEDVAAFYSCRDASHARDLFRAFHGLRRMLLSA